MNRNSLGDSKKSILGWRRRGWLDIINSILRVCTKGSLKTYIAYECNLNSEQVQEYVDFLLSRGMLERKMRDRPNRFYYMTTERGKRYIRVCQVMTELSSVPGSELKRQNHAVV